MRTLCVHDRARLAHERGRVPQNVGADRSVSSTISIFALTLIAVLSLAASPISRTGLFHR
jgi:hypothetical protein